MVTIEKAGNVLTVTAGAYRTIFRDLGYRVLKGVEGRFTAPPPTDTTLDPKGPERALNGDLDDIYDDDADAPVKPISEMDFKELKSYASSLGINVNGMSSKKELRAAIRKALAD